MSEAGPPPGRAGRDLHGQVACVTGAASGIGRAVALLLAERGADLALFDIAEPGLLDVAQAARALGRRVHAAAADIADLAATAAALTAAEAALGRIDILVNNAGIGGREAPFQAIDPATFDRMMGIHVRGAFFLTQAVVRGMRDRGYGRIVSIASNRAQTGYHRSAHYSAAKAALLGLTKAWAQELAPDGILVNAIAPGVVATGMTLADGIAPLREEADRNLLKRWAEPVEIAYTVGFLVSAEADFMTGQLLCPNGGDPIVGI